MEYFTKIKEKVYSLIGYDKQKKLTLEQARALALDSMNEAYSTSNNALISLSKGLARGLESKLQR